MPRERKSNLQLVEPDPTPNIDDIIVDYDSTYLECRDLRHPWKNLGFFRYNGQVQRQLLCPKCETSRIDTWTTTGARVSTRYVYPDGYQFSGIGHAPSPEIIRREVLNRVTLFDSKEQLLDSLAPRTRRRVG